MIYDLIKIGIYTGASIEEIYSEKVADIPEQNFTIKDSKTPSGNRQVPIHDQLRGFIKEVKNSSQGGFL